ncbi:MAG: hypothetical protein USCGTAYLOR_01653 [Chromatiales bacterium USCg_Taylor]|nr:MAG: hypothetical protein USCGTAYLOR_01653 [Chromatiales bacterium USCg_Taylor]
MILDGATNTYCITGIPFNSGAQVTPNYLQTTTDVVALAGQGPAGCETFVKIVNGARFRRGPRYVRQDIQVTLAPSVSRRVIPFAATVLS